MTELKEKFKNFIAKARTIKNIEIIVAVVIICIVAIIYSSITVGGKEKTNSQASADNETVNSGITEGVEQRLETILSQINGAGKVSVMVSFSSSREVVTADSTNTHTNTSTSNGVSSTTTTQTQTPILVNNELVILKELMPEVIGVVVVAEGASSTKVRLDLQRAIQAVLNVDANIIEIFAMK